jgi:hypothetical protein
MEGVFFSFTAISARYFNILLSLNRWVPLKEREFTISKFQQFLNSTTHQIICLDGSSIP